MTVAAPLVQQQAGQQIGQQSGVEVEADRIEATSAGRSAAGESRTTIAVNADADAGEGGADGESPDREGSDHSRQHAAGHAARSHDSNAERAGSGSAALAAAMDEVLRSMDERPESIAGERSFADARPSGSPLSSAVTSPIDSEQTSRALKASAVGGQDGLMREAPAAGVPVAGQAHAQGRGADLVTLSANATMTGTPTGAERDEAPSSKLVARGLAALASQKGGSMQIRLDPPSLGDLRITMTVVNGTVSAELRPASSQAHALLAADLASLRHALEAQGLSVDRLSVQSPTQQGNGSSMQTGHGFGRGEQASAGQPAAHSAPQAPQSGSGGQQDGGSDRQQQRSGTGHDAGQGQSRGRSDSGSRDEREAGSRSRRRASFASVFSLRDMS